MLYNKEKKLERNISELLQENYIIPLYQRNYNWGITEIRQFIQDIYECFESNQLRNYYIGSLVVFKRRKDDESFEVIDGQQRLTTIHLLARLLANKTSDYKYLQYDSREEVEAFFRRLTIEKEKIYKRDEDEGFSNLVNFFAAVNTILHEKLQSEIDATDSIAALKQQDRLDEFARYFFNNVMLVRVEMPPDTDVANYFEIMNNRGRQLQEHEILKALLMSKIQSPNERIVFGNIWDSCSQIDRPIHKFFSTQQRTTLFGEDYDKIYRKKLAKLQFSKAKVESYSLLDILETNTNKTLKSFELEHEEEVDEEIVYTSIIDFTNFLIHVLKLIYKDVDIPLSSDKLLKIYHSIPTTKLDSISPLELLEKLFFYRVVFDRFIVKSEVDSENTDQYENEENQQSQSAPKARWMLLKPVMYMKNTRYRAAKYPSLNFKNTFEDRWYQDRAVKLLSMLQVTYRQRKNKNYLQFILGLFNPDLPTSINISAIDFLQKIEGFTLEQFNKLNLENYFTNVNLKLKASDIYAEGTNTPHFVFNLIDYLLWIDQVWNKQQYEINEAFDFTYRNSIEHHYPQALEKHLEKNLIEDQNVALNSLGNLFLIGKSANSKLNDREPLGKAADPRFNSGTLTPKRRVMYNITNANKRWKEKEIIEHYKFTVAILEKRKQILAF